MSGKNSIQVAIKVRPLLKKEKEQICWRIVNNSIQLSDSQAEPYTFDHIFDQDATNQIIFDKMAKQIVHSAIQGFNGTIFAYGQTSSGKTYTMMGDADNPGVMVLAAKEIFKEIERTKERQFLLRVGYIEIYNEKIYDLLNKKNQDLKIHETPTGIVCVNCEEMIIRCENDLLSHLEKGGKERTVGETNMNERSSRSHAIFRIIIESQKIDRTEDDAVIQSVINLVDLAGSERADQTGARGTRLKEGGHINKSLLFLSNVIKRLSENEDDKYISYRDSKLTRILQASLGGNALTAIICTIKPNAVEETQSTLNFALRAKDIKNKPQVNEIVSDATMMKRLENEIQVLKNRLEEEQKKNASQIKVRQLEQRIRDEVLKIISSNSLHSTRIREKRRRTWCPSSTNLDAVSSNVSEQSTALPLPIMSSVLHSGIPHPSRLLAPKISHYNTPLITMRPPPDPPSAPRLDIPIDNFSEIDEEFAPAEMVNFEVLSDQKTPPTLQLTRNISITPKLIGCAQSTLEKVENDLQELQRFTNLENKVEVQHEPLLALKHKVETLSQRNAELEKERLTYLQLKKGIETSESLIEIQNKVESLTQRNAELEKENIEHLQLKNLFEITTEKLTETEKRCEELQLQLSELTNSNKTANEKIAQYEADLAELKKTNEKLEMENREAVNLEFELKRHQNKSKLRETELLEALGDKEKEVTKLEKSLNALNAERIENTKIELLHRSSNEDGKADEDGKLCIKCDDLQRLLEENKKITLEFEKLTLEYERLKLNFVETEKENEKNKLKIVHLEELQEKKKDECEKLLLDVEQLKDKLAQVQRDYELLGIENSLKHEECMSLNRQVEVAKNEMVMLEDKFAKLELSWQEQQKTINDIEAQYATIQTKYEQLQTQYEQLEATRGQSLIDYRSLEKENVNLQTEIEELKRKVHDAQQRLFDSNTKDDTKTATEQYSPETSKTRQENEHIQKQLLEIQTQFDDLQKEYDDLSNQLMDNLQESEQLKVENTKFKEMLKEYEQKEQEGVARAEAEISELKSEMEKDSSCHNSSMRSSGACVEEEEDCVDSSLSQEMLKKFCELSESLAEIELEHTTGKTKLFKSISKNSTSSNYKMYLKNILGVHQPQKELYMEIENLYLQGSFKQHSFHIVKLSDENEFPKTECENISEYVEKLKEEIIELKATNEQERLNSKSLLESTERALIEMREQITQLSAELLEKSIFVENCACKTYQKQIENLEKEKSDITLMCEELQEKLNCTLNDSLSMNNTTQGFEIKAVDDDKLKQLEKLKLREQELCEKYNSQTKTLNEITQRCVDMETELEITRKELNNKEREFTEKCNQLQLENLQKLELSANEYRDNMKKYNKEWEDRRDEYEQTIKNLQNQISCMKQATTTARDLKMEFKGENISCNDKTEVEKRNLEVDIEPQAEAEHREQDLALPEDIEVNKREECKLEGEKLPLLQQLKQNLEIDIEAQGEAGQGQQNVTLPEDIEIINQDKCKLEDEKLQLLQQLKQSLEIDIEAQGEAGQGRQNVTLPEDIEIIKQDKCKLEEEKLQLLQQLNGAEELLENMKEENRIQCEEITLLDAKVADLNGNSSLKTEFDNIREDLNCIPVLHDKNRQLSDEMNKLNLEYSQLKDKLQEAESQIRELCQKDRSREVLIQTLKTKLSDLKALEEEKKSLAVDFDNLKLDYKQVEDKLQKAEKQIQEFCYEDSSREELVQSLQTKLSTLTAVNDEKKSLEIEIINLKELLNGLQEKEVESCKEIDNLNQKVETSWKNVCELENTQTNLLLKISVLEEKLVHIKSEYNLIQTDKFLWQTQINELTEENKSLNGQIVTLQDEKKTLEEQLKCLKEKEKIEEMLKEIVKEKAELEQNLRCKIEKLEIVQNELEEKTNLIAHVSEEKAQIQQDLESLKGSLTKAIEVKNKQLEETENEKEKTKQDNTNLYQDLQALRQDFTKVMEEKQEQQQKMEECQRYNCQLKTDLSAIEQEKQEQQITLDKLKQEHNNLKEDLKALKQSLSEVVEQKQQEFNKLEVDYQKTQQENLELQQQLKDLKGHQDKKLTESTQLQTELQATKDSLAKLQEEQQNLKEKLIKYQKLEEDKNKLEGTLNVLKKAQTGALSSLQEEKDKLLQSLQKYEEENKEFKEKEETLKQKIYSLNQQLHEIRGKAHSYEQLSIEHEDLENALTSTTAANEKLQQEISQLTSKQDVYVSKIENLTSEVEKLNKQLQNQNDVKQTLETKLSQLEETLHGEQSSLHKEHHDLKSSLEELKLKCDSLELSNTRLENLNQEIQKQLNSAKERLQEFEGIQDELRRVKIEHSELQQSLKETVEEAERCRLALREDIERHKQLLQNQLKNNNTMKIEMESKLHSLGEEKLKLSASIEALKSEKLSLEEKLREITIRNFEQDLQRQVIDATANTSTDSNASHSPKGRRSLDRMSVDKVANQSLEEKLSAVQVKNTATAERKNRRLSTHDERRRQSYWGATYDKETMTDAIDSSCNCIELDRKLKECERNLFIKNSQVTALSMELKNHPLKDENIALKKRLQEEQEKHRIEIKRYKNKLYEQTAKVEKAMAAAAHSSAISAHVAVTADLAAEKKVTFNLPKIVANAEIQTENDLTADIQKLQGKYNDLKNICRYRYNLIKELEEKVAQKENSDGNSLSVIDATHLKMLNNQCESLKKELKTIKEKYETAKKVLQSRREEIATLRAKLENTQ